MHLFPVMFAFLIFVASEAFERCDCVFRLSVYMNILICLYDIIYVGLIPPMRGWPVFGLWSVRLFAVR